MANLDPWKYTYVSLPAFFPPSPPPFASFFLCFRFKSYRFFSFFSRARAEIMQRDKNDGEKERNESWLRETRWITRVVARKTDLAAFVGGTWANEFRIGAPVPFAF